MKGTVTDEGYRREFNKYRKDSIRKKIIEIKATIKGQNRCSEEYRSTRCIYRSKKNYVSTKKNTLPYIEEKRLLWYGDVRRITKNRRIYKATDCPISKR